MYVKIGKPKKTINPLLFGAAGLVVGAGATVLSNQKIRQHLNKQIARKGGQAKKAFLHLQEKAERFVHEAEKEESKRKAMGEME